MKFKKEKYVLKRKYFRGFNSGGEGVPKQVVTVISSLLNQIRFTKLFPLFKAFIKHLFDFTVERHHVLNVKCLPQ